MTNFFKRWENWVRIAFGAALLVLIYLTILAWNKAFYIDTAVIDPVPTFEEEPGVAYLENDLFRVSVNLDGAILSRVELFDYDRSLSDPRPSVTLDQDELSSFIQADVLEQREDFQKPRAYTPLPDDGNPRTLGLTYEDQNGVRFNQYWTLSEDNYDVNVRYEVKNASAETYSGKLYAEIHHADNTYASGNDARSRSSHEFAMSSEEDKYEKVDFKKPAKASTLKHLTAGQRSLSGILSPALSLMS